MSDPKIKTRKGYKLLDTTPTGAAGQALNDNFTRAGDFQETTEAAISGLNTSVASKASQTAVDALASQIGVKADQSAVDALQTVLDAGLSSKADAADLTDLATAVAGKVGTTDLTAAITAHDNDPNAHDNIITPLRSQLSSFVTFDNLADALTDKVDQVVFQGYASTTSDRIDAKADQIALTMHEADQDAHGLSDVRSAIQSIQEGLDGLDDTFVSNANLTAALTGYATTTALTNGLAAKANQSDLTSLSGTVSGNYAALSTAIGLKANTSALASYLKLDGSTAMTGSLNMNGFGIGQVGNISAISITAGDVYFSSGLNFTEGDSDAPVIRIGGQFDAAPGLTVRSGDLRVYENASVNGFLNVDDYVHANSGMSTDGGIFASATIQTGGQFVGDGSGITGLTKAQVGLSNVLNVASYSKTESDAYTASVTSQLSGKLSTSGGTVTGTTTFGSDLNVSGTFTQSHGDTYNSVQLRNSVSNRTWQFSQRPSFDANPHGFDFYYYDGSGWSTKLQLKTDGTVLVPGQLAAANATFSGTVNMGENALINASQIRTAQLIDQYAEHTTIDVQASLTFNGFGIEDVGHISTGSINTQNIRFFGSLFVTDDDIGQDIVAICGEFGAEPGLSVRYGNFHAYADAQIDGGLNVGGALYCYGEVYGQKFYGVMRPDEVQQYGPLWFTDLESGDTMMTLNGSNGVNPGLTINTGSIYGNGSGLTNLPSVRSVTVEAPTATENITLFYCDKAMNITKLSTVLVGGSSPSVTWSMKYASARNGAGIEVVSGGTTTTSTSGASITSFTNGTVPAGSWLWLTTSAASGTPTSMTVTITT